MALEVKPVGVIHSPFNKPEGTPIQPVYAIQAEGTVEVFKPFVEGLKDLEGFDRVWLLYWCHRSAAARMKERSGALMASKGIGTQIKMMSTSRNVS